MGDIFPPSRSPPLLALIRNRADGERVLQTEGNTHNKSREEEKRTRAGGTDRVLIGAQPGAASHNLLLTGNAIHIACHAYLPLRTQFHLCTRHIGKRAQQHSSAYNVIFREYKITSCNSLLLLLYSVGIILYVRTTAVGIMCTCISYSVYLGMITEIPGTWYECPMKFDLYAKVVVILRIVSLLYHILRIAPATVYHVSATATLVLIG